MRPMGTPNTKKALKVLLLGAGELGKEVAIELQRYAVHVVAVDRYASAPAMQVAHRSRVISMLDAEALREVIYEEKPDIIVPEVESIATDVLQEAEREGIQVIPTARAVMLTMDRVAIRELASKELVLNTSAYRCVDNYDDFVDAITFLGFPCVVKPNMSSSGKGQSIVKEMNEIQKAWHYAQKGARGGANKIICEQFIPFDFEITLLTIRHRGIDGETVTSFCEPIGHEQVGGDYRVSWQPHPMSLTVKQTAEQYALAVTESLGGHGVFGVELFIKGEEVYFNEVSPRPHDTGMVTMISQNMSEFALHARAVLGLPIPYIEFFGPSASSVILVEGDSSEISYEHVDKALMTPGTEIRLFGKPEVRGVRRMGVALARGQSVADAKEKAEQASETVIPTYSCLYM